MPLQKPMKRQVKSIYRSSMTLKDQVKNILIEFPETRNSDIALTIYIWQKFYGVEDSIDLSRLYELPSQDNIKRVRAFIQNEQGLYLPTDPEIMRVRGIKEQEWKQDMGYPINKTDEKIINNTQSLL